MQDFLQFLQDLPVYKQEQPFDLYGYPEQQSDTQTNCQFETKAATVADARKNITPTIETHGFTYVKHQSSCELHAKHFETVGGDNKMVIEYLGETVDLVQRFFNAEDVICFDWRFRRRDLTVSSKIPPREMQDIRNWALPTGDIMHCDYSAQGGRDRLKMHLLPEELAKLESGEQKALIANVWRPLNKVVRNTPLLFADKRTVRKDDLIEVDKVLKDKVEKSYYVFHRDYHKWYFLADQKCDEVAIFPTWTSETNGLDFADCSPHGAGSSETDGWQDPRQSIEVRLIVIQRNLGT